jgi:hypothetical protein
MLIKLHESKLFTIDPATRFAREYGVEPVIWNEVWKRYLAEYDLEALAGYVLYKTGRHIKTRQLKRWLVMTEIHCRANHIMLMGIRVVQSEYFGQYEQQMLEEVLRNMKYSGSKESRTIV